MNKIFSYLMVFVVLMSQTFSVIVVANGKIEELVIDNITNGSNQVIDATSLTSEYYNYSIKGIGTTYNKRYMVVSTISYNNNIVERTVMYKLGEELLDTITNSFTSNNLVGNYKIDVTLYDLGEELSSIVNNDEFLLELRNYTSLSSLDAIDEYMLVNITDFVILNQKEISFNVVQEEKISSLNISNNQLMNEVGSLTLNNNVKYSDGEVLNISEGKYIVNSNKANGNGVRIYFNDVNFLTESEYYYALTTINGIVYSTKKYSKQNFNDSFYNEINFNELIDGNYNYCFSIYDINGNLVNQVTYKFVNTKSASSFNSEIGEMNNDLRNNVISYYNLAEEVKSSLSNKAQWDILLSRYNNLFVDNKISNSYLYSSYYEFMDNTYSIIEVNDNVILSDVTDELSSNEELVKYTSNDLSLKTGSKLTINYCGIVISYDVIVKGDVTGDGLVISEDIDMLMKHLVDLEQLDNIFLVAGDYDNNGSVNVLDVRYLYNDINNIIAYNETDVAIDIVGNDKGVVNDTYQLKGYVDGVLNAIMGEVEFDSNQLNLIDIKARGEYIGYVNNNKYIYLFTNDIVNNSFIEYNFKLKTSGITSVIINNNYVNGDLLLIDTIIKDLEIVDVLSNNNRLKSLNFSTGYLTSVFSPDKLTYDLYVENDVSFVIVTGKLEDDRAFTNSFGKHLLLSNTNVIYITVIAENKDKRVYTINVYRDYNSDNTSNILPINTSSLSSNNYIKSLIIDGYKLDFDKYKTSYIIDVLESVSKLNIVVELESDKASYTIEGNDDLSSNSNIDIIVVAENKNTRIYSIKVNKIKSDSIVEETTNDNNNSWIIIVVIVLLCVGFTIYLQFRNNSVEFIKANKGKD
ncbi:MAG: hypothetical protein Q4G04_01830 [bacterium]|nr:hypothetical protein [bacterium]